MKVIFSLGWIALLIVMAGCVTVPAPQGQTLSASYVGDRQIIEMNEMVFTVALPESSSATPYHNLHVRLSALVNPRAATGVSLYEVNDIVARIQPRIRARLSEVIPVGKQTGGPAMPQLRHLILQEAKQVFTTAFAKWKHASAFDVQLVIDSFYLTDLSVGVVPEGRRGWW